MRNSALFVLVVLLAGPACLTFTTVNVGTKTSLEHQLVGELEPLSEDELLVASVRADPGTPLGALEDLQVRAISARRRQIFNRDDVDELKGLGCVGESKTAELVARECSAPDEVRARISQVLADENDDRRAILDWAIATDAALTPADRPQVVLVYRRLLHERAKAGEWLEGDDGRWTRR
jgi:uncharacterized protein YdbL (DUF1318 family)